MSSAPLLPPGSWDTRLGGQRITFGAGSLDRLGSLATELTPASHRRALLVTDPGVRAAGHADRAAATLAMAGFEVATFDGVGENPTAAHVEACRHAASVHRTDLFVAVGGGSAMDCAKAANLLLTNGGRIEDFWGFGKASRALLPAIGVPTTAGTGSEAQSYALISQEGTHRKLACGDEKARFRLVILDPDLVATAPPRVQALAGIDAVVHAIESHVSTRRNPLSALFSREAWRLLATALPAHDPADMLLGAHLAGHAIELSMLGAAHACANPLTARFDVPHGAAVALMLPAVVRWNAGESPARELYRDLMAAVGRPQAGAEGLAGWFEGVRAAAGLPATLAEVGAEAAALPQLAAEAAEQWTAGFNPRPAGVEELLGLYRVVG
jgi:alcohol dehydrogenase